MPRFMTGRPALLAVLVLASAGLFFSASPATPSEQIVIHGAASGSHLKLSVDGDRIVVKGIMARVHPTGCHLKRSRMKAICPLRGASSIVLDMGPSGDMVKVRDHLPIPLTVYLGNGSDKFIGSGERDTCYPEGARRNRCIGKGGNDICITGPRNSDCVGGAGDDYCKTSTGSDGCWGGPGQDVCYMGPGQDGCHGDAGNDRLYGGANPDQLYGGSGYDHCDGGGGWGRSHHCEAGPRR
jgi:RTX calcium-binding nonapeptide repeat (4 copies)